MQPKDFKNLLDQVNKIENQITSLKGLPKLIQDLMERVDRIEERINPLKKLPKDFQDFKNNLSQLEKNYDTVSKELYYNREQIEEKIKVQEEIIMDMIKKFNDEFFKHKSEITQDLENLKSQQDVLKISYTINEKKLMDKIRTLITTELKDRIGGQESEILMKIWIDEFKEIAHDFEKFKKLKPKEFNLKLNEILITIEQFKSKIQGYV